MMSEDWGINVSSPDMGGPPGSVEQSAGITVIVGGVVSSAVALSRSP